MIKAILVCCTVFISHSWAAAQYIGANFAYQFINSYFNNAASLVSDRGVIIINNISGWKLADSLKLIALCDSNGNNILYRDVHQYFRIDDLKERRPSVRITSIKDLPDKLFLGILIDANGDGGYVPFKLNCKDTFTIDNWKIYRSNLPDCVFGVETNFQMINDSVLEDTEKTFRYFKNKKNGKEKHLSAFRISVNDKLKTYPFQKKRSSMINRRHANGYRPSRVYRLFQQNKNTHKRYRYLKFVFIEHTFSYFYSSKIISLCDEF